MGRVPGLIPSTVQPDIPCKWCLDSGLWGTVVIRSTHRLILDMRGPDFDTITEVLYLCRFHAETLASSPLLRVWETIRP